MNTPIQWLGVLALVGLAAAVSGYGARVGAAPRAPERPPEAAATQLAGKAPVADPGLLRRLAALEARAQASPPANSAPSEARDERRDEAHTPSPELIQRQREQWEARLELHRREPIDPAWGPQTQRLLSEDIKALHEASGIEIRGADCRMTSCVAQAKFASFHDAVQRFRALTHHPYRINCGRVMMLPEPPDLDAPYEAQLLLDCEDARAEGHLLPTPLRGRAPRSPRDPHRRGYVRRIHIDQQLLDPAPLRDARGPRRPSRAATWWLAVRQGRPSYVDRGGEQVLRGPFLHQNVRLRLFGVSGDLLRNQEIADRYLNRLELSAEWGLLTACIPRG